MSASNNTGTNSSSSQPGGGDQSQITHVLNKDKKYLSEHGQKLFNAINVLLDDNEQLELTQALFKYQRDHNVFTLVRSCRELFDTSKKKSLMLFMRPVIPVKDRFHYDEYYKLFFPEEFTQGVESIFKELIPKELLEKTMKKAEEKRRANVEREREREIRRERDKEEHKRLLDRLQDLNMDMDKLGLGSIVTGDHKPQAAATTAAPTAPMATSSTSSASSIAALSTSETTSPAVQVAASNNKQVVGDEDVKKKQMLDMPDPVKLAGFRIIDLEPKEDDETLGFDICMGPTGTFVMISYVEPNSLVEKLGMRVGDELVSVNETSFKMIDLDQAIEFMPEVESNGERLSSNSGVSQFSGDSIGEFGNDWIDAFGNATQSPAVVAAAAAAGDSKTSIVKKYIRRLVLRPRTDEVDLGIRIRGGIEFALGIFVSYVKPNSTADLLGMRVCDQIIDVNGQKFSRISHEDAEFILKTSLMAYRATSLPIKIAVRYLGKLPVLKLGNGSGTDTKLPDVAVDTPIKLAMGLDEFILLRWVEKTRQSCAAALNLSPMQFSLFRRFLDEYLIEKINIQYFLFLLTNRVKLSKKLLNECHELSECVRKEDEFIFRRILNDNFETQNENVRYLSEDFKNSLIVRSTEVLNDLNINPCSKLNKYERFENLNFRKKKTICKSLDCLNPNYW